MEIDPPTFLTARVALLAILAFALLIAKVITALERRLVTSAAILLAGVFFVARAADDPVITLVGAAAWALGLAMFFRAGISWNRAAASRAGPLAVVFLLPPAFFGAVLMGGLVITLIDGPTRLALRLLGG